MLNLADVIRVFLALYTVQCFDALLSETQRLQTACFLHKETRVISKVECILKCRLKYATAMLKDGLCYCQADDCSSGNVNKLQPPVTVFSRADQMRVNSGYTSWSEYSNCMYGSDGKGRGDRVRTRTCYDPYGDCSGDKIEKQLCQSDEFVMKILRPTLDTPLLKKTFPPSTHLSFCLWAKWKRSPKVNKITLFQSTQLSPTKMENFFGLFLLNDKYRYHVNRQYADFVLPTKTKENIWYNICASASTTTATLYINATKITTTSYAKWSSKVSFDIILTVGQDLTGSKVDNLQQSFTGSITQLNIFNKELTTIDISNAFHNNIAGIGNQVVRWSEFKDKIMKIQSNDVIMADYPFKKQSAATKHYTLKKQVYQTQFLNTKLQ